MSESGVRVILRTALVVDAAVFLSAALFNFGAKIPLGFTELDFPVPIWQAGTGEAVIGLTLLAAAITGRTALTWVAFGYRSLALPSASARPKCRDRPAIFTLFWCLSPWSSLVCSSG